MCECVNVLLYLYHSCISVDMQLIPVDPIHAESSSIIILGTDPRPYTYVHLPTANY